MRLRLASRLTLALTLYRIRASKSPDPTKLCFSLLPIEINNGIFCNADLVAYVTILDTTGGAPLVTPEVEEKLLIDAAEEVQHLDMYDDNQRARLSAILRATRYVMGRRSGLPTTIDPDTDLNTLKNLAAQLEVTFLECDSLSNSRTWSKHCLAALLGKDTLIKLLLFLSKGFFDKHVYRMLEAAAVVGDFDTLRAVVHHAKLAPNELRGHIPVDVLFSGSVDFVQKIVDFIPNFISQSPLLLETAIKLNHRSLFVYLYEETAKQPLEEREWSADLMSAFEALASRGWEDLFKLLYAKHPRWLYIPHCLEEAAKQGRINILKYLLFQNTDLAKEATPHLDGAFEAAIGRGNIDAMNFLLGKDEHGNPILPYLRFTQLSQSILRAVSRSNRWEGIEHLMQLKKKGDIRFAEFELAIDASEAVIDACMFGSLRVLRHLLQKDSQGQLLFAFEDLKKLLRKSLVTACYHGHRPIVQELLKYSIVNPAFNGNEALMRACKCGNHPVVRELLRDPRIDLCLENDRFLESACKRGHLLVVRELLQKRNGQYIHKATPAAKNNEAFIAACQNGNLLVVRELLQHKGVDPGARNNAALITACKHGHLLVVRELLQKDGHGNYTHNVDPAAGNDEALVAACKKGHVLVVRELLQHPSVNPAARTNEPLITACKHGHLLVVQELLQRDDNGNHIYAGINPAARNNAPLIDACENGHLNIVKSLAQRRPNAHGVMEYEHAGIDAAALDNLALNKAIEYKHTDIVEFLLQKTAEGDYLFPGIAIPKQAPRKAASWRSLRLHPFLV